jgi:molecular chaperone Hsp33
MERALISLGPEELRSLIDEQGQAELTCRFCDNVQTFTREQLERLYEGIQKKPKKN